MSEHIERATRAICNTADNHLVCSFPSCHCKTTEKRARAALESIQITPMMLARAWEVCNKNRDMRLQLAPGPAFKEAMQAMLNELLK